MDFAIPLLCVFFVGMVLGALGAWSYQSHPKVSTSGPTSQMFEEKMCSSCMKSKVSEDSDPKSQVLDSDDPILLGHRLKTESKTLESKTEYYLVKDPAPHSRIHCIGCKHIKNKLIEGPYMRCLDCGKKDA